MSNWSRYKIDRSYSKKARQGRLKPEEIFTNTLSTYEDNNVTDVFTEGFNHVLGENSFRFYMEFTKEDLPLEIRFETFHSIKKEKDDIVFCTNEEVVEKVKKNLIALNLHNVEVKCVFEKNQVCKIFCYINDKEDQETLAKFLKLMGVPVEQEVSYGWDKPKN